MAPSTVVACIAHPAKLDVDAFRDRVAGLARPVEILALPYRESLAVRMARRSPPLSPELEAKVPPVSDTLRAALARCEVLMGLDVPVSLLDLAPSLRWVQAYSAGTEHFPMDELAARGIELTTASGAGAGAIAEFAIGRLLEVWKDTRSVEAMQRARRFTRPASRTLAGCTLGVVGLGAIGSAIATRARALGMRVLATRRRFTPGDASPATDELLGPDGLHRLLAESDAVVLCAPDTPDTRDLIRAETLAHMKPGAVLCNVARGTLVDERALVAALESGQLGAAVLDVTRVEPLPADDPLFEAPNVYLSPHCAVAPDTYDARALELFAENLARYCAGEPLRHAVGGGP